MDWLSEVSSEGRLHSSGRFTLDPVRARALLARYTHAHPFQYWQNLVAAAVCREARYFEITKASSSTRFDFDGEPAQDGDLAGLLHDLLLETARPERDWLRWLAKGVLGALQQGRTVGLASSSGMQIDFRPDDLNGKVNFGIAGGWPFRLEVILPKKLFGGWLKAKSSPAEVLQACRFAPLRLTHQGNLINVPFLVDGRGATVVTGFAPLPKLRKIGHVIERNSDSELSCAFELWSANPKVWIMVAGILHPGPPLPYSSQVLIAVKHLEMDINGQKPREGEMLDQILEEVEDEMLQTIIEMAEKGDKEASNVLLPSIQHYLDSGEPDWLADARLLEHSHGARSPLKELRGQQRVYVSPSYSWTRFYNRPVFQPACLEGLESFAEAIPLTHLDSFQFIVGGFRPPRPEETYLLTQPVGTAPNRGFASLTALPDSSKPAIAALPTSSEIMVKPDLPAGLHLVLERAYDDMTEIGWLEPAYLALIRGQFSQEISRYHLFNFFDYLNRQCLTLRRKPGSGSVSATWAAIENSFQYRSARYKLGVVNMEEFSEHRSSKN